MNILIDPPILAISASQKLVKANAMLCKLWQFVNVATIKSIYCAIFYSHLSYVCTA